MEWQSRGGFPARSEVNPALTVAQTAPRAPASPQPRGGPCHPGSSSSFHSDPATQSPRCFLSRPGLLLPRAFVPGLAPPIATWLLASLRSAFRQCHLITEVLAGRLLFIKYRPPIPSPVALVCFSWLCLCLLFRGCELQEGRGLFMSTAVSLALGIVPGT